MPLTVKHMATPHSPEEVAAMVQSQMAWVADYAERFWKRHRWLDADELLSDLHLALWRAVRSFKTASGVTLGAFVCRVVCQDARRARQRVSARQSLFKTMDDAGWARLNKQRPGNDLTMGAVLQHEIQSEVRRAVGSIPDPLDRHLLTGWLDGREQRSMAREAGIHEVAAHARRAKARRRLARDRRLEQLV